MSRTNLILLVLLIVVAGGWLLTRDANEYGTAKQSARLFPEFNKEAADRVVIEGGWLESRWVLDRLGSGWKLSSAGGYPAKKETLDKIVDAVHNLRRENLVGESDQLRKDTRTGDLGRLVRVFKGDTPMAEFRVGKNPKQGWQTYFVRGEGEREIYRTRTILTKDRDSEVPSGPMGGGPSGFGWDTYLESIDSWVERKIWDLGDAEAQEIWLTREDLEVKLVRKGEDQWELKEGEKDPVPADADAASAISSSLRYLNLDDVMGRYEEVRGEYGLDKPAITLVLTLKKKIEKKKEEEAKPSEGEEKEEKAEEEKKEEPKEEFKIIHRTIEVGSKIKLPRRFNEDEGKVEEEEFYPIHVGGDFDDPDEELRAEFVFLVDDYVVRNLKKDLEELKQEPPEEEEAESDESEKEATPPEEEKGDEAAPPEEDQPAPEKGEEEPTPPEEEEPVPEEEKEPTPPEKEEPAPEKEEEG